MADSDSSSGLEELTETTDFRERLHTLKVHWKSELKKNKKLLLKCPNYERCQSKCGSVGGMIYHYERCAGNAPQFKCEQCDRTYESRTGLNYHMASAHLTEPIDDPKTDSSSRPQRVTALNTMSAIHIANNPPSLKHSPVRTPPKNTPPKSTPPRATPSDRPSSSTEVPVSPKPFKTPLPKPPATVPLESSSPTSSQKHLVKQPGTGISKMSKLTAVRGEVPTEVKTKKGTKYVTIPSIEYPDEYKSYLPVWRHEMKDNKLIKCPNYKDCDFKCTTVNGMKYHFVRCKKANPPEFNCELCKKKFQCRTGLVWHLKKTHKLVDIQPSKTGGFKAAVPTKLPLAPPPPEPAPPPVKKKVRLSESGGRENRSPAAHKKIKSFSRRKRYTPQKTPDEILQNVVRDSVLPSPTLGPRAVKALLPLSHYHIVNNVSEDEHHVPRAVIQLGEEALNWQQMSSESESEGDFNHEVFDEEHLGSYRSSYSLSDSDDDYLYGGGSKKKVKPKPVVKGERRRGRPLKNPVKQENYEPIPLATVSSFASDLPTLESKETPLPQMPALIKATNHTELDQGSYYDTGKHVQPPPGLLMPVKSDKQGSIKLPKPPPLLKNKQSQPPDTYPHIVLPSSSSIQSWSSNTHTLATAKPPKRLGRPPKNAASKDGKRSTTVRLDSTSSSSKGSKGQSYSTKGSIKMTQYEFQQPPTEQSVTDKSPTQKQVLSYGGPQNLVSPVQIIQGVPSNALYQTVQPGGVVLMQAPGGSSLGYTTQQPTYQLVQSTPLTVADQSDNPQKVSVIMQSPSGFTSPTGVQYLTQLDGPPPKSKHKHKKNLKSIFEAARQKESDKLSTEQTSSRIESKSETQSPQLSTLPLFYPDVLQLNSNSNSNDGEAVIKPKPRRGRPPKLGKRVESSKTGPPAKRGRKAKQSGTSVVGEQGRSEETFVAASEEVPSPSTTVEVAAPTSKRGRKPNSGGKFPCETCSAVYSTKNGLKFHTVTVHNPLIDANTPLKDCRSVWRQTIKKTKQLICPKCSQFKASTVSGMQYHWTRCGVDPEQYLSSCPHCDKKFKSEAGLKYHVKAAHTTPQATPSKSASPESEVVIDTLPLRKAAAKASEILTELVAGQSGQASLGEPVEPVLSLKPQIPPALKEALARGRKVECHMEGCTKQFKTEAGLKYHLKNHFGTTKYCCPVTNCSKILNGAKRFETHMSSKHPDTDFSLTSMADNSYVPMEEGLESDGPPDDWEAETNSPGVEEPRRATPVPRSSAPTVKFSSGGFLRSYHGYQQAVREALSQLYCGDKVLTGQDWELTPEQCSLVMDSDCQQYLPESRESMAFSIQSNEALQRLELFNGCEMGGVSGGVLFTGGPVWTMDWLPVEGQSTEHFIALSAYSSFDETHQMRSSFSGAGLIQIWSLGSLANKTEVLPDLQFSYGLAHNGGVLREIKWYPGQKYNGSQESLGVLAAACSDGTVRVFVVPSAEQLSSLLAAQDQKVPTQHFIANVKEAARLVPTGIGCCDWSEFGQCLCLDWMPGSRCARLAAGFSNGVVCVWDLDTSHGLPGGFSRESGLVIHPVTQLQAHKAACRTVSWSPLDSNCILTGGFDRQCCVWDLRQPHSPLDKQEKGLLLNSQWPLMFPNAMLHSDCTVGVYSVCPVTSLSYMHPPHGNHSAKSVLHCCSPLTSISYCSWTDRLAAVSFGGELSVCAFSSHFHNCHHFSKPTAKNLINKKQQKEKETLWVNYSVPLSDDHVTQEADHVTRKTQPSLVSELMASCKLVMEKSPTTEMLTQHCSLSPDGTSLTAATKVAWSPNEGSYEWLLVGSHTGLVQLLHVQSPSNKPQQFITKHTYSSVIS